MRLNPLLLGSIYDGWLYSVASLGFNLLFFGGHFVFSNASDALDKLRFLSVTEPDLLKDSVDLDIRIQTDKDNGIITIT